MKNMYSIGVDLGGTNLRIASYASGTQFLDLIVIPTRLAEGPHCVVEDMCAAIFSLIARAPEGHHLFGIGIGTPGPLELPAGILRNPPNLHDWDGFNLRQAVELRLGQSVSIEGDANLAALAEQKLGAGRSYGIDSMCILTLGTGVGGGLVVDGSIWHGHTGMGGEAGHIVVRNPNGYPCGCGGRGCLEQYASATAIVRMAREFMGKEAPVTSHEIALLARLGDERARVVFATVGESLAVALAGLINTLNLPLYLLGGGVCDAWDLFAPAMFRELHQRSYIYRLTAPDDLRSPGLESSKTYILKVQLGSSAGLLGACLLPFQNRF